jgi:hypothetical protein
MAVLLFDADFLMKEQVVWKFVPLGQALLWYACMKLEQFSQNRWDLIWCRHASRGHYGIHPPARMRGKDGILANAPSGFGLDERPVEGLRPLLPIFPAL